MKRVGTVCLAGAIMIFGLFPLAVVDGIGDKVSIVVVPGLALFIIGVFLHLFGNDD